MWMNSSTAEKKKSSMASNYFQIMVAAGANGPCVPDIEKVHASVWGAAWHAA